MAQARGRRSRTNKVGSGRALGRFHAFLSQRRLFCTPPMALDITD